MKRLQIVGANAFAIASNEIVEKLRRLVDLMQVGLQVRFPTLLGCAPTCDCNCKATKHARSVVQLETIEQNNQILDSVWALGSKMDCVAINVSGVGSDVQLVREKVQAIIEKQDSHHKQVPSLLKEERPKDFRLAWACIVDQWRAYAVRERAPPCCPAGGQDRSGQARAARSRRCAVVVR